VKSASGLKRDASRLALACLPCLRKQARPRRRSLCCKQLSEVTEMKYLWLLLLIALVVSVITLHPAGLRRVDRISFDGAPQAYAWWNSFAWAASTLDYGLR
jgi:hypothetical protein